MTRKKLEMKRTVVHVLATANLRAVTGGDAASPVLAQPMFTATARPFCKD